MTNTEIYRRCDAILKKHEGSYLSYAITPSERKRLADQGLISPAPAVGEPRVIKQQRKDKKPRKTKYTEEQMRPIIRQFDELRADGMSRENASKLLGVSRVAIEQWRLKISEKGNL